MKISPMLALSAALSVLAAPGCTRSDPTSPDGLRRGKVQNSTPCAGIPNCQLQQQSPVRYGGLGSNTWAYYCSGDHPYFWGAHYAQFYERWVQTNKCFSTAENPWAEGTKFGDPGKLDVTVTNWCLKKEDYVISLACSNKPPPLIDPSCGPNANGQPVFTEPGCPKSNVRVYTRSAGAFPATFQLWNETCAPVNGVTQHYSCSLDEAIGLLQCIPCTTTTSQ